MIMKTERFLGSQENSYGNEDNNNFSYFRIVQNFVFVYGQVPLSSTNVGVFNVMYSFSTALFRLRYTELRCGKKIAQMFSVTIMARNLSFGFNEGEGASFKKIKIRLLKSADLRTRFCVLSLSVGTKPGVTLHLDVEKQDTFAL
jgi:hypothetical protein